MGSPLKKVFGLAKKFADPGKLLLGAVTGDGGPKPPPVPSPMVDAEAYLARDRVRRQAKAAQGRDSTIRTSTAATPYSGTPKSLLGT